MNYKTIRNMLVSVAITSKPNHSQSSWNAEIIVVGDRMVTTSSVRTSSVRFVPPLRHQRLPTCQHQFQAFVWSMAMRLLRMPLTLNRCEYQLLNTPSLRVLSAVCKSEGAFGEWKHVAVSNKSRAWSVHHQSPDGGLRTAQLRLHTIAFQLDS